MKKLLLVFCLTVLIVLSMFFTACSQKSSNAVGKVQAVQKVFTLEELKKFDGKNGNPAYVAVDGTVYDVTNIKKWKDGMHKGYAAGADLSQMINSSPHGKKLLKDIGIEM